MASGLGTAAAALELTFVHGLGVSVLTTINRRGRHRRHHRHRLSKRNRRRWVRAPRVN